MWGAGALVMNKMDKVTALTELSAWWGDKRKHRNQQKNKIIPKCHEAKKQGLWHRMTGESYVRKELRPD